MAPLVLPLVRGPSKVRGRFIGAAVTGEGIVGVGVDAASRAILLDRVSPTARSRETGPRRRISRGRPVRRLLEDVRAAVEATSAFSTRLRGERHC